MTTTSGGYVTDVAYVAEFYADHAPPHLNLTAAAGGFRPRPLDAPFTWCDYGCGNGVTAAVLAGCYPHANFYGVDFLPAHIRTAEVLALRGGLANVQFIAKSFTELAPDDIPPLDFAVMHGVLSWIDEPTRAAVLDDAARRLKPGGILLTGCNAMPGWAAKIPLRNMIYSLSPDSLGTIERAKRGLAWMQKLKAAQVKYFRDHPALAEAVDQMAALDPRYMAHEYFNQHLRAFYFAELAALMAARGLKFAGSATVFLNMVDLAVAPALQDEFRAVTSRAELEAKRDFVRNETFRRDVWVKGEPVKTEREWLEINLAQVYGTLLPLGGIDRKVAFGDVQIAYEGEPFDTLLATLAGRAVRAGELPQVPGLGGLDPPTAVEAARLVTAGGQVVGFARPTAPVAAVPAGVKLTMPAVSRGLIKELGLRLAKVPLAAVHAGTGLELPNIDAIVLMALVDTHHKGGPTPGGPGEARAAAIKTAHKVLSAEAGDVVIGGKTLSAAETERLLASRLTDLTAMLPKLVEIGVVSIC